MIGGCSRNPQPSNQGTKTELQLTNNVVVCASRKAGRPHRLVVNPSHTQLRRHENVTGHTREGIVPNTLPALNSITPIRQPAADFRAHPKFFADITANQVLDLTALDTQPVAFEVHVLLRTSLTVRILHVSNVGMHARTAVKDNVPSPPLGSSRPVFHFPIDWLNLVGFILLVETFWTFSFVLD